MRSFGTVARGLRCPIFKPGDDIVGMTCEILLKALSAENIVLNDRDIIALKESIVARSQNNFVHIDEIANDVKKKFGEDKTIGFVWPITSRNRVANTLRGVARGAKEVVLMLSYPNDEVDNMLVSKERFVESGLNPNEELTTEQFVEIFGEPCHKWTGVNYFEYFKSIIPNLKIVLSNDARHILKHTKNIICADVHSREQTKKLLLKEGAEKIFTLAEILNEKTDEHGYNEQFGLLGANMSCENTLKLFPRDCNKVVGEIQAKIKEKTGKTIEVMVYGDGAYKNPVGNWELYDPVVSPGYTDGLEGSLSEVKLKVLADNLINSKTTNVDEAVRDQIRTKEKSLKGKSAAQGTTPSYITDLVGSLSDLISGSGDKGTPIVFIQGYFDNYAD